MMKMKIHSASCPSIPHCHWLPRRSNGLVPRISPLQRRMSIGFELPGSTPRPEKSAADLYKQASTLLLYTAILKGKPAVYFLELLVLLQKGAPEMISQKYGEFYRALASETSVTSWQDWLLDQVLKTAECPFSRAAARGDAIEFYIPAVEQDLNVLQQLAVSEFTIANWVTDSSLRSVPSVDPTKWSIAASSLSPRARAASTESALLRYSPVPENDALVPTAATHPLSNEHRAAYRADLAGRWRWGDSAAELGRYHRAFGVGLVSCHRALVWNGTSLQGQDALSNGVHRLHGMEGTSSTVGPKKQLLNAVETFVESSIEKDGVNSHRPPHTLLVGSSVERWLAASFALNGQAVLAKQFNSVNPGKRPKPAIRTVILPFSQLSTLNDLLWTLSKQPRVKFSIYLSSIDGLTAAQRAELVMLLSGFDGFLYPSNVQFIAGADAQPPDDDLLAVFKEIILV